MRLRQTCFTFVLYGSFNCTWALDWNEKLVYPTVAQNGRRGPVYLLVIQLKATLDSSTCGLQEHYIPRISLINR